MTEEKEQKGLKCRLKVQTSANFMPSYADDVLTRASDCQNVLLKFGVSRIEMRLIKY